MLTDEQAWQLNIQQHELESAQIGYARAQEKMNRYESALNSLKENYASYSPEIQAKISSKMGDIITGYQNLKKQKEDYALAEYEAQQQITYYNELDAKQQPINQGGQRRRVVNPNDTISIDLRGDLLGYLPPNFRPGMGTDAIRYGQNGTQEATPNETWEDIYNSGGWNEFKKGFNNALVDDAVLPIASALGASDDTLGVLSELKIPATEREMASKYYALGGWGKDAADAYLQYAGMRAIGSIPELVGAGRGAGTTYTIANSGRGIYNTPNAWRMVNRAGSNYSPAFWNRTSSALRQTATSSPGTSTLRSLTPTETNNFWEYAATHEDMPMISTIRNFNNGLL